MHKGLLALSAALVAVPLAAQVPDGWDADGDGIVDEAEFRDRLLGDGAFGRWDADEDGLLGESEFAGGLFRLWSGDDGSLTVDEWDRAVDLWFGEGDVNLSVDRWDADGDGEITREEFVAAVAETELFARIEAGDDADELLGEEELADALFAAADVDEDRFLGDEEDWFLVDLIELFNVPDEAEEEAVLEAAAPEEAVEGDAGAADGLEAIDAPDTALLAESFVGLPVPCGAEDGCRQTAQRFCSVLGLGEPVDFFDTGGEIYAIRCSDGL